MVGFVCVIDIFGKSDVVCVIGVKFQFFKDCFVVIVFVMVGDYGGVQCGVLFIGFFDYMVQGVFFKDFLKVDDIGIY